MANYRAIGGGILSTHIRLTDWKSFNANAVTSLTTDFKPKGFVLVVNKPTDTTQHVAYYTNFQLSRTPASSVLRSLTLAISYIVIILSKTYFTLSPTRE